MTKGKLFVVSGPSGAGKGTICKRVIDQCENIRLSISMTTRSPREGEQHQIHYHFVEKENFEALIAEDGFMEYAKVYGNFYGTPKKQVLEWLEQGINVILEIDVQGALQVKKAYPASILIFILPPSLDELKARITGRGSETEETMAKRLGAALHEISQIDRYDYRVVNDRVKRASEYVMSIIAAEQCRMNEEEINLIINGFKEEQ